MKLRLAALLALGGLAAAFRSDASAADDTAVVLSYGVAAFDGDVPPTAETIKATAAVVAKRCVHAEFGGVTANVASGGDGIDVRVPKALAGSEEAIRHLVERRGLVEFRLRARASVEDTERDRRLQAGAAPPAGFAWCPDDQSVLLALVETPEAPVLAEMDSLLRQKGSGPDLGAAYDEASAKLVKLRAESVFTNADVASASVRWAMSTQAGQWLRHGSVRFEFREDRRAAFEKFTGDHVGRALCVVVDGRVHVCPVINAAIPGMGELRAPGTGYTDAEAREMAALLECGALAVKLVPSRSK